MPAGAKWEWLEAYGPLEADPKTVHSSDWPSAIAGVEKRLDVALPHAVLDEKFRRFTVDLDRPPLEILHLGSGWGALENRRRGKSGLAPFGTPGAPFPDESLGSEQQPWLKLLDDGKFPPGDPTQAPGAYMVQPEWRHQLEEAIAADRGVHWLSLLHLGIMRYHARDAEGARQAWERSIRAEPSAWALRNLAVLADDQADLNQAAHLWLTAARIIPDLPPLAIEACEAMLKAGQFADLLRFVQSTSPVIQTNGRVRLLTTIAALRNGDLSAPQQFFSAPLDIPNIPRRGAEPLRSLV